MHSKFSKYLQRIVYDLEVVMAIIIAIGVIIGIPDLFKYFYGILISNQQISYNILNEFLKHVLMLVVGLELMTMVLTHSHESILTLVLFVVARKMLVYAAGMTDILIGTIAIAIIFVTLKFFVKDQKLLATLDNNFSAALPIDKLKREFGYDLPSDVSNTLGGFVYELSRREGIKTIEPGIILIYGNYRFTIKEARDNVIQRVKIEQIEDTLPK